MRAHACVCVCVCVRCVVNDFWAKFTTRIDNTVVCSIFLICFLQRRENLFGDDNKQPDYFLKVKVLISTVWLRACFVYNLHLYSQQFLSCSIKFVPECRIFCYLAIRDLFLYIIYTIFYTCIDMNEFSYWRTRLIMISLSMVDEFVFYRLICVGSADRFMALG